jgi:hypothetical protein
MATASASDWADSLTPLVSSPQGRPTVEVTRRLVRAMPTE